MNRLKDSLQSVLPDPTSLGGDSSGVDRHKLRQVLTGLASDLSRTLAMRTATSLVLIVALSYLAWQSANAATQMIGAVAGIGIVAVATVLALREVSDELARTRMLLVISPDLSREALTEVTRWLATAS